MPNDQEEEVKMQVSDFNLQKINTAELEQHVKCSIEIGS